MLRRNRGNDTQPHVDVDDLLTRWIERGPTGAFARNPRVREACLDVVETLAASPQQVGGALTRFGRQLGAEGWTLGELSHWVEQLALVAGDRSWPLHRFDAGVALAEGWSSGYLYGLRLGECTDALTGLATLPVLRLRLQQVHAQCTALGVPTEQAYCVVVIDTDSRHHTMLERDAALVVLADHAQRTFGAGETIAISGGRVFVLASYTDVTEEAMMDLVESLRGLPLLHESRVVGWVEELPATSQFPDLLDTFLFDLAG